MGCTCSEVRVVEVKDRTILVDATLTPRTDPRRVVVLVSDPSGDVSAWWTADQLPVEAEVDNGDLVTFAYKSGAWSIASSYRVTSDVTAVTSEADVMPVRCTRQEPTTVLLTIPAVEGAASYSLSTSDAVFVHAPGVPDPVTEPGTYAYEVIACSGVESFDVLVWARQAEPDVLGESIAFARVDGIPYAPGATVEIPLVFSVERAKIEVAAHGTPGTLVGARSYWFDQDLDGAAGFSIVQGELSPSGQANLTVSPLALPGGRTWVQVWTPPSWEVCESQIAWKHAPFGDPFEVFFDQLAAPVVGEDGNMAIASVGEVGDVLIREEGQIKTALKGEFALWRLHEDPAQPQPLPAKPTIPPTVLPGFVWPTTDAEVTFRHRDERYFANYAELASESANLREGRDRVLFPKHCD